jgi:hypothetical protein
LAVKKPPMPTPIREPGTSSKDPVIHARGEESADELVAQRPMPPTFERKSDNPMNMNKPTATKEKESDAWDIPAFLRRRKK